MQGLFGKRVVVIENPGLVGSHVCGRLPTVARKVPSLDCRTNRLDKAACRGGLIRRPDRATV